jgi:hypothetical protein
MSNEKILTPEQTRLLVKKRWTSVDVAVWVGSKSKNFAHTKIREDPSFPRFLHNDHKNATHVWDRDSVMAWAATFKLKPLGNVGPLSRKRKHGITEEVESHALIRAEPTLHRDYSASPVLRMCVSGPYESPYFADILPESKKRIEIRPEEYSF